MRGILSMSLFWTIRKLGLQFHCIYTTRGVFIIHFDGSTSIFLSNIKNSAV